MLVIAAAPWAGSCYGASCHPVLATHFPVPAWRWHLHGTCASPLPTLPSLQAHGHPAPHPQVSAAERKAASVRTHSALRSLCPLLLAALNCLLSCLQGCPGAAVQTVSYFQLGCPSCGHTGVKRGLARGICGMWHSACVDLLFCGCLGSASMTPFHLSGPPHRSAPVAPGSCPVVLGGTASLGEIETCQDLCFWMADISLLHMAEMYQGPALHRTSMAGPPAPQSGAAVSPPGHSAGEMATAVTGCVCPLL